MVVGSEISMYLNHVRRWGSFRWTPDDCWEWCGSIATSRGIKVAKIAALSTHHSVRRLVWEQTRSPLGRNFIKAKCGNQLCCNPYHLEVVAGVRAGTAAIPETSWFETNDQGCWLWTGKSITYGYGYVMINGKRVLAHRRAWEVANDKPVPEGLVVRHACDNPPCCRPDHLLVGTQRDNSRDMASRLRGPAKFDWDAVSRIRQRRAEGLSLRKIAEEFRCSHKTVDKLCKGKTYSDTSIEPRQIHIFPKPDTPCWEWQGSEKQGPYGRFKIGNRMSSPHRRAWEIMRGPIPPGMQVLHTCDNKRCFLIDHLRLGTAQDNTDDWNGKRLGTHKIDFDTADHIRHLRSTTGMAYTALGRQFGIDPTSVLRICRNELYVRPQVE